MRGVLSTIAIIIFALFAASLLLSSDGFFGAIRDTFVGGVNFLTD